MPTSHAPRSIASSFGLRLALALTLATTLLSMSGCASRAPLLRQAVQLNSRGATLLSHGDLAAAEASFQLALEYNDRFAEPHNNLGLVALARGRMRVARQHFRNALLRNPDFAEAWSNLGIALLATEDRSDREATTDAAMQAFREALGVNPGLIDARANLIRLLLRSGRPDEALVQSRRLVQLDPRSSLAHTLRAESALARSLRSEAYASVATALGLSPDDAEVRLVAARVALDAGDIETAEPWLRTLTNDRAVGLEARALLAAVALARGDREGAHRMLRAMGRELEQSATARRVRAMLATR